MWKRAFLLLPLLLGTEDVSVGVVSGYSCDIRIVADSRLINGMPCYGRTVRQAGLAAVNDPGRMRITYRTDGHKILVLLRDARYLEDGVVSAWARLHPRTVVSVRAGRRLEGIVEVYQIIWGRSRLASFGRVTKSRNSYPIKGIAASLLY